MDFHKAHTYRVRDLDRRFTIQCSLLKDTGDIADGLQHTSEACEGHQEEGEELSSL
jgi:hypothetical protein